MTGTVLHIPITRVGHVLHSGSTPRRCFPGKCAPVSDRRIATLRARTSTAGPRSRLTESHRQTSEESATIISMTFTDFERRTFFLLNEHFKRRLPVKTPTSRFFTNALGAVANRQRHVIATLPATV